MQSAKCGQRLRRTGRRSRPGADLLPGVAPGEAEAGRVLVLGVPCTRSGGVQREAETASMQVGGRLLPESLLEAIAVVRLGVAPELEVVGRERVGARVVAAHDVREASIHAAETVVAGGRAPIALLRCGDDLSVDVEPNRVGTACDSV